MDLALVDRLICPRAHEPVPLIVRADEVIDGRLVRGAVGCPECRAEWPVQGGVVQFDVTAVHEAADVLEADTIAALLALTEPGRLVLADGAPATLVSALMDEFGATVVALDAPAQARASVVLNGAALVPLAAGAVRGVLLLRPTRSDAFIASAASALTAGGRMVAAVAVNRPPDVRELARDERFWVAERERVTAPVALRRAGR